MENDLRMLRKWNRCFLSIFIVQLNATLVDLTANVTREIGSYMDKPFTAKEIIDALAQMCPTKALGPDGLPVVFLSETFEFSQ